MIQFQPMAEESGIRLASGLPHTWNPALVRGPGHCLTRACARAAAPAAALNAVGVD